MVERGPEKAGVVSSILTLGTNPAKGGIDPEDATEGSIRRTFERA